MADGAAQRSGRAAAAAGVGGRLPRRTAPAIGAYSSSTPSAALRSSRPPRLMSPRPTKSIGNRRRVAEDLEQNGRRTSAEAMLPSSTTSAVRRRPRAPAPPRSARAAAGSAALSTWTSAPAKARSRGVGDQRVGTTQAGVRRDDVDAGAEQRRCPGSADTAKRRA